MQLRKAFRRNYTIQRIISFIPVVLINILLIQIFICIGLNIFKEVFNLIKYGNLSYRVFLESNMITEHITSKYDLSLPKYVELAEIMPELEFYTLERMELLASDIGLSFLLTIITILWDSILWMFGLILYCFRIGFINEIISKYMIYNIRSLCYFKFLRIKWDLYKFNFLYKEDKKIFQTTYNSLKNKHISAKFYSFANLTILMLSYLSLLIYILHNYKIENIKNISFLVFTVFFSALYVIWVKGVLVLNGLSEVCNCLLAILYIYNFSIFWTGHLLRTKIAITAVSIGITFYAVVRIFINRKNSWSYRYKNRKSAMLFYLLLVSLLLIQPLLLDYLETYFQVVSKFFHYIIVSDYIPTNYYVLFTEADILKFNTVLHDNFINVYYYLTTTISKWNDLFIGAPIILYVLDKFSMVSIRKHRKPCVVLKCCEQCGILFKSLKDMPICEKCQKENEYASKCFRAYINPNFERQSEKNDATIDKYSS